MVVQKPASHSDWASTAVDPTDIEEPSDGRKATGWTQEKPPYQYFNWLEQNADNWAKYFEYVLEHPNWTSAQLVGSVTAIATVGNPAVAALSERDVAFIDSTNKDLRLYRFDGTDFAQVGNDLNIAGAYTRISLTALSTTRVAFLDNANEELRVYDFDEGTGNWAQVGNDFTMAALTNIAIVAVNETDIVFTDESTNEMRMYHFDGADFAQVGNSFTLPAHSSQVALAALNETDVVYCDGTNNTLQMYRFDGTDFAQVGNDLVLTGEGPPYIAGLNSSDFAFIGTTADELKIFRFDESDFSQIGGILDLATVSSPSLSFLNGTDLAFIDATNMELRVYRFGFSLTKPYSVAGGAF